MIPLLDAILRAHGGLECWRRYSKVEIDAVTTGGLFPLKGLPDRHIITTDDGLEFDEQRLAGFDDRLAIIAKHIAATAGAGFAALGRFLPGGIFACLEAASDASPSLTS